MHKIFHFDRRNYMKVSTKGRYGLRALVDLTINSEVSHVSLISIAERQNISSNYLEQVFAALRKAGIVKSIKGSQGGYILADKPANITVAQIIKVLEGDFNIADETIYEDGEQDNIQLAVQSLVWDRVNKEMTEIFNSVTLEQLANEYRKLNADTRTMYYI